MPGAWQREHENPDFEEIIVSEDEAIRQGLRDALDFVQEYLDCDRSDDAELFKLDRDASRLVLTLSALPLYEGLVTPDGQ